MFRKFNWGWGIALFYSAFVVFMMFMVWECNQMKTQMVTDNYYGKELKYQEQLDKIRRSNSLGGPLRWMVNKKSVRLTFPVEVRNKNIKANILFYRPDNSANDFNVSCFVDSSGSYTVSSEKFRHGEYRMQVDWMAGNKTYYNEGVINID